MSLEKFLQVIAELTEHEISELLSFIHVLRK